MFIDKLKDELNVKVVKQHEDLSKFVKAIEEKLEGREPEFIYNEETGLTEIKGKIDSLNYLENSKKQELWRGLKKLR